MPMMSVEINIDILADALRAESSKNIRSFCEEIASDSDVEEFFLEHFKVEDKEIEIVELKSKIEELEQEVSDYEKQVEDLEQQLKEIE